MRKTKAELKEKQAYFPQPVKSYIQPLRPLQDNWGLRLQKIDK
jgi:hypothetical protein